MWLLRDLSWNHLRRHRGRTLLTLAGIAVGVAAMVATSGIVGAVLGSFERAVEATSGRAELQITNGGAGVSEELVESVRDLPGIAGTSGFVEGLVPLADGGGESLAIFGFDVLADNEHEAQIPRAAVEVPDELAFVSRPDSIALGRRFAEPSGLGMDAQIAVSTPAGLRTLVVRGLVDPVGPASLFGGRVALMDLPAAQRLLSKDGRVDRIDVRLAPGGDRTAVQEAIAARLTGGAKVEETAAHGRKAEDILFSLRVLMSVAGLIALVVGFFIIYHTVAVSTVQRRREAAILAAVGVSRRALMACLAVEAVILGGVAAAIGSVLGVLVAQPTISLFGGITSAWIDVPPDGLVLSWPTFAFAGAFGVGTTVLAAVGPAWRLTRQPIAPVLHLVPHDPARVRRGLALPCAFVGLAATALFVTFAPRTLPYARVVAWLFAVNSLALVSFALLAPPVTRAVAGGLQAIGRRLPGLPLLLASGTLARNPAGPIAVVAAIVLGIGWTLADATAILSMKQTWLGWVDEYYQADLVVQRGNSVVRMLTYPPFEQEVVDVARALPGVREAQATRILEIELDRRPAVVIALDRASQRLPLADASWDDVADAFWSGRGVALTENLAHRIGLHAGDMISVPTPGGARSMPILGVFADFSQGGDLGGIALGRDLYRQVWGDDLVTRLRLWTDPDAIASVRTELTRRYGRSHGLHVVTFAELRGAIAELVESAFSLTYGLILVALVVSFVGVVNFLLAAVLDRRTQIDTMRAIGVTARQVQAAIVVEGLILGAVGVLIGVVAGAVVSWLIVAHGVPMVNGWHFTFAFPTSAAVMVSVGALVVAGLASVGPARAAVRRAG